MSKRRIFTWEQLPEILTAQDIADIMVLSRKRVYELMQVHPDHGGIPNFIVGASRRVDKSDLLQWKEGLKEASK